MNIEEIDKWLDNEYGCSYTKLEELHNYWFEKSTNQKLEIERLKEELQDTKEHLGEYLYEQEEENKRLNNIINELEKSWKEEITRFNNFIQEDSSMIEINNIRKMLIQEREKDLYKLQELKGDK